MKIKTRLVIITAVAAIVSLIIGYIGISNLSKLNEDTSKMTDMYLPSVQLILNADRDLYQVLVAVKDIFETIPGSQEWEGFIGDIDENYQQVVDRVNDYAKYAVTQEQKELISQHESARDEFRKYIDEYLSVLQKGTPEAKAQAAALEEEINIAFENARGPLDGLTEASLAQAEETRKRAHEDYREATTMIIAFIAAGLIVLIVLSYLMSRSILKPIETAVYFANKLAEGDFREIPSSSSADELGEMLNALGKGFENLRRLINEVAEASEQVAASSQQLSASAEETTSATEQVASTIQDLSSAAQNQAEKAQNVTETVQEMDAKMQNTAGNLRSIAELAHNTNSASADGSKFVKDAHDQIISIKQKTDETSDVIKGLGQKSKEIAKIVDMITNIADQTNLLALNAAIEAARAGDQGRGFAVVAEEVRKLAEESSNAAEEIAALIGVIGQEAERAVAAMEESTLRVNAGTEVIAKVEEAFRAIASHINELSGKVQEISAATQEIAEGSRNITQAMESLLELTEQATAGLEETASFTEEQNASMEEVASSAEKLAELAQELNKTVEQFRLA
ncbi:MAG TPA: hypothetical protein DEA47_05740 [Peptococcaceae bacterium]|nr:MAG: Chemotaxis sensory transducer [Clostridia bacterium 41_269]HBT20843.1 hypothetical protein [Peptococcaceae bacterium]